MKNKIIIFFLICVFTPLFVNAQISGTVFRDFNGDGTRTTTNPSEPLVASVIVNAYNAAGTLIASYTTTNGTGTYPYTGPNYSIPASGTYNGTPGSNTGGVPASTPVRLEFVLSATGCVADASDYSSKGSSSVQFVTAPSTTTNYAINNPADYNTFTGTAATAPSVFTPVYVSGNPLGGGASGTANWFVGYPYTNTGTTAPTRNLAGAQIGTVWGEAYSKQAQKIFTSAFLKRHSGYGPMGSGGIYLLTPTATSFTVVQFFDMDNNSFNTAANPITRTSADATAPAYGNGSSFTLSNTNRTVTFNGSTDPVSGFPSGLGVIGTNVQRGLPAAGGDSYDGAAFDQVGKVGIGDIEISDDGKYLFVMNLYQRKVFRLELNSASNPTSVVSVSSYAIPAQTCTNGVLRGFATKFYKGKLYVGAVCTGENETTNTNANLSAKIFELTNATATASFNTTPVLNYPLTYTKGLTSSTSDSSGTRWYPWVNDLSKLRQYSPSSTGLVWLPQPILSDIEFTDKGDMLMSFMDRIGHQVGNFTYYYLGGSSTTLTQTEIGGDILIAGKNCSTGFVLENNGSYTSNGVTFSVTANGEGPGGGEFFKNDLSVGGGFSPYGHAENSQGAMAVLPGTNSLKLTIMDPFVASSGGLATFNVSNAAVSGLYELYNYTSSPNYLGKANGLGDLELNLPTAPLEIGNRVWNDTDADGIQDAGETGIAGITLNLYQGSTQVATTTTASDGTYYFNSTNVTMNGATGLLPNTAYEIRIPNTAGASKQAALGANSLIGANAGGNDLIDSDATLSGTNAIIALTTGNAGENNHTYDIGFSPPYPLCTGETYTINAAAGSTGEWYKDGVATGITTLSYTVTSPGTYYFYSTNGTCSLSSCVNYTFATGTCASIGNYVWNDANTNGINDEPTSAGINGVTVELYRETSPGSGTYTLTQTTTTANNGGNPGYYIFYTSDAANFKVKFPTTNAGTILTTQTTTAATDNNSDANTVDGYSPVFAINPNGTGVAKDNMTIDAGFKCNVTAIVTGTTITCNGATTTLTASGGDTYAWNTGETTAVVSKTAGTYTVTVTVGTCSSTVNITVTNTNVTAAAGNDVTVNCTTPSTTLTATGGSTYLWSNAATTASINVTPTTTTTYTMTVTDSNGCTATDAVVVTANKTIPSFTTSKTNISCFGATDGTITINASGGLAPYEYSINNGNTYQNQNVFTNLAPTIYQITVKDANGCIVHCQ